MTTPDARSLLADVLDPPSHPNAYSTADRERIVKNRILADDDEPEPYPTCHLRKHLGMPQHWHTEGPNEDNAALAAAPASGLRETLNNEMRWLVGRALGYITFEQDPEWVRRAVASYDKEETIRLQRRKA